MPLIAVLRGLPASDAKAVGAALVEKGLTVLEVPVRSKVDGFSTLNKDSLESIRILIDAFGERAHITAGTVKAVGDIQVLKAMGLTSSLAPNFTPAVVAEAKQQNMQFVPGIETISEANEAFALGAYGLKLFPCIQKNANGGPALVRHSAEYLQLMSSFVPLPIYPSGGLDWDNLGGYLKAGGFRDQYWW